MSVNGALLVLVFVLVLFAPGVLVCLAAGLRRWTAVAVAPLVTYGLTALTEQGCILTGASFGPLPLLVVTLLVTVLTAVIVTLPRRYRWLSRKVGASLMVEDESAEPAARSRAHELIMIGGVALGTLVGALTALAGMGSLDTINQDWDASFHANATRFILDTGNADPGALSALYPQASLSYPNTWHALGAVVGRLTGASIPALLGTQTLLVAGLAGLGLAALIRGSAGRVAAAAVVPLLLASFTGFPIDVLWRGPLLPFAFGVALIPAFLLLLSDTLSTRRPTFILLTAIAAVGLMGLQPATALTAAVFSLALVISRWLRQPRRIRADLVVAGSAAILTVILGLTFVSGAFLARGVAAEAKIDWPAVESPGQAVGDLLLLNHAAQYPQYWLVVLLGAGALGFSQLRSLRWLLAGTAVFAVLFVAAAAYDRPLTESVTLPWWNDRWRFVAIVTLGLALLAAHGVVTLADGTLNVARRISAIGRGSPRLVYSAAVVVVLGVVGVGSSGFYAPYNAERLHQNFSPSSYVSSTERAAMSYLAGMVQPGDRVMNDPKDGSVWMYALQGIEPIFGHVVNPGAVDALDRDAQILLESFTCIDSDQVVRDLIEKYHITYVFLGGGFVREGFDRAPGLRGLGDADSLHLVYAENGVRIFSVDLAPLQEAPRGSPTCSPGRP